MVDGHELSIPMVHALTEKESRPEVGIALLLEESTSCWPAVAKLEVIDL
jgi:hypothetical protein